jgi:hypothetical protein
MERRARSIFPCLARYLAMRIAEPGGVSFSDALHDILSAVGVVHSDRLFFPAYEVATNPSQRREGRTDWQNCLSGSADPTIWSLTLRPAKHGVRQTVESLCRTPEDVIPFVRTCARRKALEGI